jgi:UDP-3-O-[3-hydroxymyristoyl] N-acetylglucosamine deacetylase
LSLSCGNSDLTSTIESKNATYAYTLKNEVNRKGVGLFSGVAAEVFLCPAPIGHGIVFKRIDLPNMPEIQANLKNVHGTPRCTIIGNDQWCVQTVEHILSALYAYGITNLLIKISGPEIPIFDGSSMEFVKMIEEAGVLQQDQLIKSIKVTTPLYWSSHDVHIVALPSEEFKVSYTLHYPHSKILNAQFFSLVVNQKNFKDLIASCRTFSFYEEIMPYIEKGFLKGGSLDNAVLIKEDKVVNPDGLRFSDEMARHKVLDLIGDLSLVGAPVYAHVIAIRSGHFANNAFAKVLFNHINRENL